MTNTAIVVGSLADASSKPEIEEEIGEKVLQWDHVAGEYPTYLALGVGSYLRLRKALRPTSLLGDEWNSKTKYRGMTIVIVPVDEFVEVSSGHHWSEANCVLHERKERDG